MASNADSMASTERSLPKPNISLIKNKQLRAEVYRKLKAEKRKEKMKEKKRKQKEAEALGDKAPPKEVPKTIENMRVHDETMVNPEDDEVKKDEAEDEMSAYFCRGSFPKILITTSDRPCAKTKRKFRQYDIDALAEAYKMVKEKNMPVREAARLYKVPETTLRTKVHCAVGVEALRPGPPPLFSTDQESRLLNHVTTLDNVGYMLTRQEICHLATEFAVDLGLRKITDPPLSLQWYRGIVARWPNLAVKKPRSLGLARKKATSEEKVDAYFEELKKILDQYKLTDKPQNIYKVHEVGISDSLSSSKIVRDQNKTPFTVNILGGGNAFGTAIPAYFIFPGLRMRPGLLDGLSDGANGTVSKTGCCNGQIFRHYLVTHFIKFVRGRNSSEPLLLLYDGYHPHISLGVIEWAKQQNMILFVLPPHSSYVLQPLEVECFGLFQKVYNDLSAKFMKEESVSSISKFFACEIGCQAYSRSLSSACLHASFKKYGIYPFNPDAVKRISFGKSTNSNKKAAHLDPDNDSLEATSSSTSESEVTD